MITVLVLTLLFLICATTGAYQKSLADFNTNYTTIKIIKSLLLTLKQKEMFIPMCYLVQADDYDATPEMHRDGLYIYLKERVC